MDPMDPRLGERDLDVDVSTDEQAGEVSATLAGIQQRARALADRLAVEIQEHPIRSVAIAGLVGFVIASSMKHRTLPAMLRSGAAIAAAMALREIAERGLSRLDVGGA